MDTLFSFDDCWMCFQRDSSRELDHYEVFGEFSIVEVCWRNYCSCRTRVNRCVAPSDD